MQRFIAGVLIMMLMSAPAFASSQDADVAAIKTVIESMASMADRNEYDALVRVFAPEVMVDYTSLAGGKPELKSNTALMTAWAALLPGFDRTRHVITDITVTVDGEKAVASSHVTASHWIDELFWEVSGTYDYTFIKEDREWRISSLTLNFEGENGTRDVFGPAIERSAAQPDPYLARQQTRQVVIDFLTALESKEVEKLNELFAEDAVQDMPFSPEGFPKRVNGRDNIVALYAGWPAATGHADFTSELIFHPMLDGQTMFVEFKGDVDVIATGRKYKQTYGALFHVESGKIKLYRELYDPEPFKYAFKIGE